MVQSVYGIGALILWENTSDTQMKKALESERPA